MKNDHLAGIFSPITTPFENNIINYSKLDANIEKYNHTQLRGYLVLSGNGEYLGLTEGESLRILETVAKAKDDAKALIAGCGRESAYLTIQFIRKAACFGAEYACVTTPFYYAKRMRQDAMIEYFIKVADDSPMPIIIDNSPNHAAEFYLTERSVGTLSRHPNIVALINSCDISVQEYNSKIYEDDDFCILVGKAKSSMKGLREGAVGAVLSIANYLPEKCCELFSKMQNGVDIQAQIVSESLVRVNSVVSYYGVPGIKYAMSLCGYYGEDSRLPLIPIKKGQQEAIQTVLYQEGYI